MVFIIFSKLFLVAIIVIEYIPHDIPQSHTKGEINPKEKKEGSFYGYNEKTDNYFEGIDD